MGLNKNLDLFLRPVHWILSRKSDETINYVVISPYEANELLPSIRQSKVVTLHVYSPRASPSARVLDDLSFCAVPATPTYTHHPSIITQLNLIAGQLYFKSYDEYLSACRFLGLCFCRPREDVEVAADGFVLPRDRIRFDRAMTRECSFDSSVVGALRVIMATRRHGQDFRKTHIGRLLHSELLSQDQTEG